MLHHFEFIDSGIPNVTRECKESCSRRAPRAQRSEGRATIEHDPWQIRYCLNVVHHGGLTVETDRGREEGGLNTGISTLAFQGFKECRFFPANVRTRTGMNDESRN